MNQETATSPLRATHQLRAVRLAWWPYALVTAVIVLLRLPTLSNRILSIDEASYLVQALRLGSVETFTSALSHHIETKTQVGLLPYLFVNALDRENAILIIHVFGLIAVVIAGTLLVALSKRCFESALPGVAAALMWAIYLVVGPGSPEPTNLDRWVFFQAPRLEYFQAPLLVLSLYWFLAGAEARRDGKGGGWAFRLLGGCGAAWAVASLIKPSAVLLGPVLLAAIPFVWARRGLRAESSRWLRETARAGIVFALGAVVPVGLVFAPYMFDALARQEMLINFTHVGASYMEGASFLSRAWELSHGIPLVLLVAFLVVPSVVWVWHRGRGRTAPFAVQAITLGWLAGVSLFVGVVPGQAHLYYLVTAIPFIVLATAGSLAVLLHALAASGSRRLARAAALVSALVYLGPQIPALISYPPHTLHDAYLARDRRRFDLDGLVAHIRTRTPPDGKMWVYYNTPELFLLSGRLPVTRDPAGIWLDVLWKDPWFQLIAGDLAEERPHMIIGIDRPRYHYPHTRPLLEIPIVGEWISRTYECDPNLFRGAVVCSLPGGLE